MQSVRNGDTSSVSRRLLRSRSAEDLYLSREQLKSTENDTVLIFIEYVRKKLDNHASLDAEVADEAERRRRDCKLQGDRKDRTLLRRLQSEPNGPAKPGETDERTTKVATASRPKQLVLERPPSKDERRHRGSSGTIRSSSNHSDASSTSTTPCTVHANTVGPTASSSATATPVPIPDPPLTAAISPADPPDFVSSYPPPSTHPLLNASSSVIPLPSAVVAGAPTTQEHYCTAQQPLTPQMPRASAKRETQWNRQNQARIIANKLKIFGDEILSTHEAELQREFARLITTQSPQEVIAFFSAQLRQMLLGLSWQNIGKVFHLSYHLIEFLTALLGPSAEVTGRPEWTEFSNLWDFTLGSITRWISTNGGWRAFLADSSSASSPNHTEDQPTCPATPSFRRVRSRLLSLSESGEFEFFDEEGQPHSADTVSTTSSEVDDQEDQMGSSVDLLHDNHLEESPSESSLTTNPPYLPATLTPVSVTPPCATPTTNDVTRTATSPKKSHKRQTAKNKSRQRSPHSVASTVAFQNGIPQLTPAVQQLPTTTVQLPTATPTTVHKQSPLQRGKSHSVKERPSPSGVASASNGEVHSNHPGLNQHGSVILRRSSTGRRSSHSAFNGLVIGVGGAAVVYAAVSALMRR